MIIFASLINNSLYQRRHFHLLFCGFWFSFWFFAPCGMYQLSSFCTAEGILPSAQYILTIRSETPHKTDASLVVI